MLMLFLARCSSQQAFTECQPIVVCWVLLQASSGSGVGLGIENDESRWKDHQGTMWGIGWEIHHEQVGDSP